MLWNKVPMSDSTISSGSSETPLNWDNAPTNSVPQFGALDIVEAFTAMRHEWRGQTKESRLLTEKIDQAVTNIQALESKLLASISEAKSGSRDSDESSKARALVMRVIETDQQLSRAISGIDQWEATRQVQAEADRKSVALFFESMNWLARWFARPFLNAVILQFSSQEKAAKNPAVEGLNLVLARLRRTMQEQGIERLDTLGQPFDANAMHAIGTLTETSYPAGHVAEQISPAYYWQGKILRFADVRIAR
ncbi:nucleotide exchange factor GrpE [Lacunimicrobium album]